MEDERMSDGDQIPAGQNRIGYPNLSHVNINGLNLRSDATLSAINTTIDTSSIAPNPSAGAGNGLCCEYPNSALDAKNIPSVDPEYSFLRDSESITLFPEGIIPSMSFTTSRNLEGASEQAAVSDNMPIRQNSESNYRHFLENNTGGHESRASQGMWSSQQDSVPLPSTTVDVISKSCHSFGGSIQKHRGRAKRGAIPPPQQSPEIVPQIREIRGVLPQQRLKMGPDEQKNLDEKLPRNLEQIIKETGTSTKKRAHDVIRVVDDHVHASGELHKDMLKIKHRENLADPKTRKSTQSNINQQVFRRKQSLYEHAHTVAVELIFVDKDNEYAENQRLKDKIKLLKLTIQQLEGLLETRQGPGPGPDDSPSSGLPPKDDGQDDDDDDDLDSGGPGRSLAGSTAGPAVYVNASSNGKSTYERIPNAQLPTGTSEYRSENSSSEESDSDEETSIVLDSNTIATEHPSVENSNDDVNRRQKVDVPLVTEHRIPEPRSINEEGGQKPVPSCAILSKLESGAELDTRARPPLIDLNAQETGSIGKAPDQCLTPGDNLFQPECLTPPRVYFLRSISRTSLAPLEAPDDAIPVFVLPCSISHSDSRVPPTSSNQNRAREMRRIRRRRNIPELQAPPTSPVSTDSEKRGRATIVDPRASSSGMGRAPNIRVGSSSGDAGRASNLEARAPSSDTDSSF